MVIKLKTPSLYHIPVKVDLQPLTNASQLSDDVLSTSDDIVIIGFGDITSSGVLSTPPTTLQQTTVKYIPHDDCKTIKVGELDFADHITDDMICTMGLSSGQCHGVSNHDDHLCLRTCKRKVANGIRRQGILCAEMRLLISLSLTFIPIDTC
jgi:hypothetical protein